MPRDPYFFPIGVWLQTPETASRYKKAGINVFVGLWEGPTAPQLDTLRAAGMPVICAQNDVGLAHRDDPTIVGWLMQDEPDNAQVSIDPTQPAAERVKPGPPVKPEKVYADYQAMKARDPSRPILLNFGQGVANDEWQGRGGDASLDDYPQYLKAGDIVSFDIYPVASLRNGEEMAWLVGKGVERLGGWAAGKKPVWNFLECMPIDDPARRATADQVRAQAWMSIINGSRGLVYFVHQFKPDFNEHALLDDPSMLAAVTRLNAEIKTWAAVINSAPATGPMAAASVVAPESAPVALTTRRFGGIPGRPDSAYVFAVETRNVAASATIHIPALPAAATVEVLGEGRTIPARQGAFKDDFAAYGVHLYRVRYGG